VNAGKWAAGILSCAPGSTGRRSQSPCKIRGFLGGLPPRPGLIRHQRRLATLIRGLPEKFGGLGNPRMGLFRQAVAGKMQQEFRPAQINADEFGDTIDIAPAQFRAGQTVELQRLVRMLLGHVVVCEPALLHRRLRVAGDLAEILHIVDDQSFLREREGVAAGQHGQAVVWSICRQSRS